MRASGLRSQRANDPLTMTTLSLRHHAKRRGVHVDFTVANARKVRCPIASGKPFFSRLETRESLRFQIQIGAGSGGRTHMPLRAADFKSAAFASFAIPAREGLALPSEDLVHAAGAEAGEV